MSRAVSHQPSAVSEPAAEGETEFCGKYAAKNSVSERTSNQQPVTSNSPLGVLFDFDTFAIHDGPGIRATFYLKGCPLSCAWCHSPESQRREPELIYVRERCVACGACVLACPEGVHAFVEGRHAIDREKCRACGACAEVCAQGAVAIKGYTLTADEAVRKAARLKPFFHYSGGGVTLTGGEVTMQPEFAAAVLAGCRAEGVPTAIETTGACAWPTLERLAALTDLVLYDLKLIDDAAHRRWVGASNREILKNAARLAKYPVRTQVRIPLIPGVTDTVENLRGVYAFMVEVGLREVALLAYNEAAGAKYEWLDRPYTVSGARQTPATLAEALQLARAMGLEATLG